MYILKVYIRGKMRPLVTIDCNEKNLTAFTNQLLDSSNDKFIMLHNILLINRKEIKYVKIKQRKVRDET